MATYTYDRGWNGSEYFVENYSDSKLTDYEGHSFLSKEIETALPGEKFTVYGKENVLECVFEKDLSAGDKITLDGVIQTHLNRK